MELIKCVETASQETGLTINKSKTKIMIIDRPRNNRPDINGINGIAMVNQFEYLGSLLTDTGGCTPEIKRGSAVTKEVITELNRIWTSRDITRSLRYVSECWILKETDKLAIDVFEMGCWWKMLRISWTHRITHESILN